jgi:hypothetical protein
MLFRTSEESLIQLNVLRPRVVISPFREQIRFGLALEAGAAKANPIATGRP